MRLRKTICMLAALSVGFGGTAFAQNDKDIRSNPGSAPGAAPGAPHRGGGGDRPGWQGRPGPGPQQRPHGNFHDNRGHDNRGHGYDHRRPPAVVYAPPPGYGPPPPGYRDRFYRGGRLPPEYRSRQYVVDDWRGHRLSAPPRGYQWVQAGGDYVLVAIATGIIASVLLMNR